MNRIPSSYLLATLRNVIPVDSVAGEIGFGFDVYGKQPIRLRLGLDDARVMLSIVQSFIIESHSNKSSEMASIEVSRIPGAEKV